MIHKTPNVSQLALDAKVDRGTLYRAFRLKSVPRLDVVIKVLGALGFLFLVELRNQREETLLNRFAPPWKSNAHPELRSNLNVADYLTRAFRTSEMSLIVEALSDTLRAQENVVAFAKKLFERVKLCIAHLLRPERPSSAQF